MAASRTIAPGWRSSRGARIGASSSTIPTVRPRASCWRSTWRSRPKAGGSGMLGFGAFAFASPWVLLALLSLPALWWLLRITPPAPKNIRFPAIRLLFGLENRQQTPASAPPWLVILRLTAASLVILGLAHPLLNPGAALPGQGPGLEAARGGEEGGGTWRSRWARSTSKKKNN